MNRFSQCRGWIGLWAVLLATPVNAVTLHQILEAAWTRQPEGQAMQTRQAEYAARRQAVDAWIPSPPSMSIMHKTDQIDRNHGYREWEAELSAPLWMPGDRHRMAMVVDRERAGYTLLQQAARLKLAGELREACWDAQLVRSEWQLAKQKLSEAQQLAQDVARREQVGDLSKVDLQQAQSQVHVAQALVLQAEVAWQQAKLRCQVISGVEGLPEMAEQLATPASFHIDSHPALIAAQAVVATAQAKLAQVRGSQRDNPELALAYAAERDQFGARYDSKVALRIRISFGGDSRNQPRITAANAELIEAQARQALIKHQLESELAIVQVALRQAYALFTLAEQRAKLTNDTLQWQEKAFKLGELDLPGLVRARSGYSDAALALARASIERSRAVSRYNQAAGVLP
ncbi:TolC family protein [Chitinivorax sp. B]|uniref:TolC family protein n=1 Tax=Chitinivorax sp. B TaxID=2502235 RepID=UPI0014858333|nr:TolC family protein [Chitinivorax sp. B]